MPTLSTQQRVRQLDEEEPEPLDAAPLELEPLELSDFVDDEEPLSEDDDEALSDDDEPESFDSFVEVDAGDVDDFLPRLSVLKNPEPLNVTPTGVKTFFTGRISPLSGWAISVRLSSWKPCWTSMVSPVSTNL